MAGTKDLLTRLADAGEEAIARLAKAPGGEQLTQFAHTMRERTDELQRKVRGLEDLEKRVVELEKRVDALSKPKARARAAAKKPAASRSATRTTRTTRTSTTGRSTGRAGGSSPG